MRYSVLKIGLAGYLETQISIKINKVLLGAYFDYGHMVFAPGKINGFLHENFSIAIFSVGWVCKHPAYTCLFVRYAWF